MASPGPPWQVLWTREAERYFARQQPKARGRILRALRELAEDPYSTTHVRALRGELEGLQRYRLGSLRIVYRIVAQERHIRVIAIASRGDIY